jgi:chromosome segregation ATPase
LKRVNLYGNVCINEYYNSPVSIAVLQQTVNEKCRFEETTTANVPADHRIQVLEASLTKLETSLTLKDSTITTLNVQITNLKLELVAATAIKQECQSDKAELKAEKLELKSELDALKKDLVSKVEAEKVQCQQKIDLFRELQIKSELLMNATYTAELNNKLQEKQAEIEELDRKHKLCLG